MPVSGSLFAAAALALAITGLAPAETGMTANKSHHTARGFRNNYPHEHHGSGDFLKFLGEFRERPGGRSFPMLSPDAAQLAAPGAAQLTWIGHDTFLVQLGGLNILTDPHFSERASPVGWAGPERMMPPAMALDALPPIDIVLISHNHYDHLDEPTVLALQKRQPQNPPRFYVPLKLKKWFAARGIDNVMELDWWDKAGSDALRVHAVPVQHFSSRGPFDRNATLWCGWVLEWPEFKLFFAGDTGYSRDFADIGARFGGFDLSLIPIGAYDPRWFMRAQHVDPEEAVQIHRDVKSARSIGMHWGTFVLTLEDPAEPPRRLAAAVKAAGVKPDSFTAMQHGETRPLPLRERAGMRAGGQAAR